jgi:hypothetical protein
MRAAIKAQQTFLVEHRTTQGHGNDPLSSKEPSHPTSTSPTDS